MLLYSLSRSKNSGALFMPIYSWAICSFRLSSPSSTRPEYLILRSPIMRKHHMFTFVLLCFSASLLARPVPVTKPQSQVTKLPECEETEVSTLYSMNGHTATPSQLLGYDYIYVPTGNSVPKPMAASQMIDSRDSSIPEKKQLQVNINDPSSSQFPAQLKVELPQAPADEEFHSPHAQSPKELELESTENSHSTVKGNLMDDPKGNGPQGSKSKPILDTPPALYPPQNPGFIKRKWQQFLKWVRTSNSAAARTMRWARNYFRWNKILKKSESDASPKGKDVKDGAQLKKSVSSTKPQPETPETDSVTQTFPLKTSSPNPVQDESKTNAESANVKAKHTVSFINIPPKVSESHPVPHTTPLVTDSSNPIQADSKTNAKDVHNVEAETVPSNELQLTNTDNSVIQTTDQKLDSSKPPKGDSKPQVRDPWWRVRLRGYYYSGASSASST